MPFPLYRRPTPERRPIMWFLSPRHGGPARAARRPSAPRSLRPAVRPRLEALEDRSLPSTFTVLNLADAGDGSLRAAVAAANAHAGADTIEFRPGLTGTIALTGGELAITDGLTVEGPGADRLTVSGGGTSRVFDIGGGAAVTLAGLTVADGLAGQGGGIDNAGVLTLSHCVLSGNRALGAGLGGAVLNEPGAALAVTGCTFTGNQAVGDATGFGHGGALLNRGTATVTNSAFTDNRAVGGGAPFSGDPLTTGFGSGGGISSFGPSLTVAGCTFTNNAAIDGAGLVAFGGGLESRLGTLALSNSTFTGNQAVADATVARGGALLDFRATASITNCTFTGNAARGYLFAEGGAFAIQGPTTVANSTFTGNQALGVGPQAWGTGGAVVNVFASLTVTNSTF